jgi:hypothetical protein
MFPNTQDIIYSLWNGLRQITLNLIDLASYSSLRDQEGSFVAVGYRKNKTI